MKEAALRYSPEMAEAFQKTFTERPATKKSLAVWEMRVAQIPRPIVAATTRTTKATGIQAVSPTMPLLTIRDFGMPSLGAVRHRDLVLYGFGCPDEVAREQPRDRVEQQPQKQPRSAEAGDPRLCHYRQEVVHYRQA